MHTIVVGRMPAGDFLRGFNTGEKISKSGRAKYGGDFECHPQFLGSKAFGAVSMRFLLKIALLGVDFVN